MPINTERLFELLNLLEEYEDELEYGRFYTPFVHVVSRDKKALINTDKEEAEVFKLIRKFIRTVISTSIQVLNKVKSEVPLEIEKSIEETTDPTDIRQTKCKACNTIVEYYYLDRSGYVRKWVECPKCHSTIYFDGDTVTPEGEIIKTIEKVQPEEISKALSYDKFLAWQREMGKKIPQLKRDFYNKLIIPVSVSYGKGFKRSMKDLEITPSNSWVYMPGHSVERLTHLVLAEHLSSNLNDEMTQSIVEGMRKGENPRKIARRLRKVQDKPKLVKVPPLLDAKGNVVRKGFKYYIPSKRYSEIIARTEVNRATNEGRLDGYQRSRVVKSVEVLTAGDKRVCDICEPLDRQIFELEEARAVIPVHAQCRCTWTIHKYIGEKPDKETLERAFKVTEGEEVYTGTFTGIPRNKQEMKKFTDDFKSKYRKLSKKAQKDLQKNAIQAFKDIGYEPKYIADNINDIASLAYHSKNLKYTMSKDPMFAKILRAQRKNRTDNRVMIGRNWLKAHKTQEDVRQTLESVNYMGGRAVIGMADQYSGRLYLRSIEEMQSYVTAMKLSAKDLALQYSKAQTVTSHELGHAVYQRMSEKKRSRWYNLVMKEHKKNKAVSTYERSFMPKYVLHRDTWLEADEAFAETMRARIWEPKLYAKFGDRAKIIDRWLGAKVVPTP